MDINEIQAEIAKLREALEQYNFQFDQETKEILDEEQTLNGLRGADNYDEIVQMVYRYGQLVSPPIYNDILHEAKELTPAEINRLMGDLEQYLVEQNTAAQSKAWLELYNKLVEYIKTYGDIIVTTVDTSDYTQLDWYLTQDVEFSPARPGYGGQIIIRINSLEDNI